MLFPKQSVADLERQPIASSDNSMHPGENLSSRPQLVTRADIREGVLDIGNEQSRSSGADRIEPGTQVGAPHAGPDPGPQQQRLGGGDFEHRIDIKTGDELEQLAKRFNSMAGQLQETYSDLELKVKERTRALTQSVNELKVLEEVGRAVVSSLDLKAVLSTVAARALEITKADAVLIYGFNAGSRRFDLVEASGVEKSAAGNHLVIGSDDSLLGQAAASGQPIAIEDLASAEANPLNEVATSAGFRSVLVAPLVDQQGVLGSLIMLRRSAGALSPNLVGLMQTFAHQAALAMRNAKLFHEVDRKGKELATAHGGVQQQADKLQEQTYRLLNSTAQLEQVA